MSTRRITRNRSQSRPSRINRDELAVRSLPPVLCILVFLFSGACPLMAYAIAVYPLSSNQQYLLFGASGFATLCCLMSTMRKRQSGQPTKKIRSYVIAGLVAGCLIAGIGYAASELVARTTPDAMTGSGELVPDSGTNFAPAEGGNEGSKGTVAHSNGSIDGASVGTETMTGGKAEKPDSVAFTPSVEITAASPVVLRAGTRLQLMPSKRDEVRLRLEEKEGQFVTGLLKTDFRLLSESELELDFKIVELPERAIAVRSNMSIIVDESLALQTQQGSCVPAIETVLQASAYSGYKLSTAGASIRTLVDWTSAGKNIEAATTKFRHSYGGNLQASLSLNVADLSNQPTCRILLLFLSSRSLQAPLIADLEARFARAGITTLVVTEDSRTAKRLGHQHDSVRYFSFAELIELQQVVQQLTTRREPPSYLIRKIEPHHGSALRLVVGSGDSAVTASLEPSSGLASLK